MHPLTIPQTNGTGRHAASERTDIPAGEPDRRPATLTAPIRPLLVDIGGLSALLARSEASLARDDAAGRLPAALKICGSKRWRLIDIELWVQLGCPGRREFEARKAVLNGEKA
jgi:hypothetical protein